MLIKKFINTGLKISKNNSEMLKILFVVLSSQYFKNVKVMYFDGSRDIRLSTLIISPTRSGKGRAISMVKYIAKKLNLSVASRTTVTEAGILGTIDIENIKYNTKNNYTEEDENYLDPIIRGDLATHDLIICNEAKTLLKTGDYNANILEVLQEALDEEGFVSKKLSSRFPIEFNSSSSIILTSYYIREVKEILFQQGIFLRMLIFVQDLSFEQRQDLNLSIIESLKNCKSIHPELDEIAEEFKRLKSMKNFTEYHLSDNAIAAIRDYTQKYQNIIGSKYAGRELATLIPFSTSNIELLIKVGCICAILDEKNKTNIIENRHISEANDIMQICMKSILTRLSTKMIVGEKNKDVEGKILQYITKHPNINKEELYKAFASIVGNRNKLVNIIKYMVANKSLVCERKHTEGSFRPHEVLRVNAI